jgi:hypothetical protein
VFKLAIIVPADGSQADLDNTLLTVLENRPNDCQVVVPHPLEYRDPYELSDEVLFVPHESRNLAALINAGVRGSKSEIVHILLSGMAASPGWAEAALRQFDRQPDLAAVAPAVCRPHEDEFPSIAGIRYGRGGGKHPVAIDRQPQGPLNGAAAVDGPLLQAMFIRRRILDQLGGLRDDFGRYHIDTDLAARLRAAGQSCRHEPDCQVTGRVPPSPRGFRAALGAERLYWCHAAGLSVRGALAWHALHVSADVLRQLPRPTALTALLGRGCGLVRSAVNIPPHMPLVASARDETVSLCIEDARRNLPEPRQRQAEVQRYSRSA